MNEPQKSPDPPHEDTGVHKAASADDGSEFDTAEMPAITDTPDEDDPDLDDTVISVRRVAGERETRVIHRKDPAADEYATGKPHLADAERPGSDFPTGYLTREEVEAAATREVPRLKDQWRQKAAEVGQDLDAEAELISESATPGPAPVPAPEAAAPVKPVYEAARAALSAWGSIRFEQRMEFFNKLRSELVVQRNDYVPSLASSIGRPMVETLCGEYLPVLECLRTLEEVTSALLCDQYGAMAPSFVAGASARVRPLPWGVVVIFTPSEAPFALPMILAIDALAAGNAVVLCPGERQPRVAENMRKLFQRAGFSPGLMQVIGGEWQERRGLLEGGPDLLIFEGDPAQADHVARAGVEFGFGVRLARLTKELMLVLGGADMDHVVAAALWASFSGGGFARGRVERIVVQDSLYDEFRMRFIEGLRDLNSHHAQLASINELLKPQRFQTIVSDAVARGARVTWPAGEEPGRWIHWKGGVIENLPDVALASVEKLEGPACALYRAQDVVHEALRLHRLAPACNVSVMGSASRAQRAQIGQFPVARISFGEPLIGGGSFAGGGADGVNLPRAGAGPRMMLRSQVVLESTGAPRVSWFPYTDDKAYALMDAIEAEYHTDVARRLKAGLRLGLSGHKRRLLRGEA